MKAPCLHSDPMTDAPASTWRTVLGYSVLRLLFFVAPLAVVYALSGNLLLSAVVAAAVGLALSIILLNRRRTAVSTVIATRVERRRPDSDEAIEDGDAPAGQGENDSAAASPKP